jgi:hypothetical protein
MSWPPQCTWQVTPTSEAVRILNEGRLNAQLGLRQVEQVVGVAVEGGRGNNVGPALSQVDSRSPPGD